MFDQQRILLLVGLALLPLASHAYPPAPHHTIFGQVRDEMGDPIIIRSAEVFLETSAGVRVTTQVISGLEPGVNYKLRVPMDSGLTSDPYKPTALKPTVPFTMRVRINGVNYLPIEMVGNYSQLGRPSEKTRLDLTLGEDSDGDGLPDAWERMLLALLGSTDLSLINPNDDFDGDGISNRDEYLAGTYAFDPDDGFLLKIAGFVQQSPVLDFLSIRGRTYKILGSHDMSKWTPIDFKPLGASVSALREYYAREVRMMRVEAPPIDPEKPPFKFYKLMVQ